MAISPSLSRREFLRLGGLGAGALVLAACGKALPAKPTATPPATVLPLPDGGMMRNYQVKS
jgi:hypothetical protein